MIRTASAIGTALLISFTMIFGDASPPKKDKELVLTEVKTSQEIIQNTSITKRLNLIEIKIDSLERIKYADNIK